MFEQLHQTKLLNPTWSVENARIHGFCSILSKFFSFYWWKRTTGIRFLIFLSRKQSSTSITKYCNQKNSQIQHESVENARNHRFCSILSKYFALLMKKTNNNIKFSDFFSCKQSTTSSPSIAPKRICKIPPPKQKIWAIEIFPLARRAKGKKRAWVARYGLLEWRNLLVCTRW